MTQFITLSKKMLKLIILISFPLIAAHAQVVEEDNDEDDEPLGTWVVPTSENAPLSMLTPPDSFESSPAFNGYISYKTSSAIIMIQINEANYVALSDGITDDYLLENQLSFISRENIATTHGHSGVIFKLEFQLEGTEFIRYMAFIGDLNKTLWLNITYPKMLEGMVEEPIKQSILSVNLYPNGNE